MSTPDTFVWSLIVEAFSINARIEGMKVANTQNQSLGESNAYSTDDFRHEAKLLSYLAETIRNYA
jgi:hypothetical protein